MYMVYKVKSCREPTDINFFSALPLQKKKELTFLGEFSTEFVRSDTNLYVIVIN